jgi:hypothetical protein
VDAGESADTGGILTTPTRVTAAITARKRLGNVLIFELLGGKILFPVL